MKQPFATGNVVRLKSGGPDMTVVGFADSETRVIANWFNDDQQWCSATFPHLALRRKGWFATREG